jgi:hypothetical protein
MPRGSTKRGQRQAIDLDEIGLNRFLVNNPSAFGVLKGEGQIAGRLFELTTWRREGLMARLRERGFAVRTIADRIAALPAPPRPPPLGAALWRPLSSALEQFSQFDLDLLRWRPIEPELRGGAGVTLRAGWALRRRKGRGSSSYFLVFEERGGGAGLRPLDETEAVLVGYAQALERDPRPWIVERRPSASPERAEDDVLLPDVELPPPYREALALFARASEAGPLVDQRGWPLARDLFGRLGVRLNVED